MKINPRQFSLIILLLVHLTAACQDTAAYPPVAEQRATLAHRKQVKPVRLLDSTQIINDLRFLASDQCEGRKPGTKGHQYAMQHILTRMRRTGVDSFNSSLIQPFQVSTRQGLAEGNNVVGWIKGTKFSEKFILISAHYDHVGRNEKGTYYGADDNASGTACLLALANYFRQHPLPHSIIFAAFDREESGLQGAFSYVQSLNSSGQLANIKLNVNLDMIARSDSDELFVAGVKHYPALRYIVEKARKHANVKLLMGHDFGTKRDDWTRLSDQYAFHKQNIPFLFISVEDHADYHQPTDTVDRINFSRYIENCNVILKLIENIEE